MGTDEMASTVHPAEVMGSWISVLGIPAWKLASNFSFGQIAFSRSSLGKWMAGPMLLLQLFLPRSQNDPEDQMCG